MSPSPPAYLKKYLTMDVLFMRYAPLKSIYIPNDAGPLQDVREIQPSPSQIESKSQIRSKVLYHFSTSRHSAHLQLPKSDIHLIELLSQPGRDLSANQIASFWRNQELFFFMPATCGTAILATITFSVTIPSFLDRFPSKLVDKKQVLVRDRTRMYTDADIACLRGGHVS